MSLIDFVALAIVTMAVCRGVWIGLIREALSFAALGAALFAVWVWDAPFAHWLQHPNGLSVRYDYAPWIAGVLLFAGVFAAVATFGHVMRGGAGEVGGGRFDRSGGGVLGAAEGVLAAGLLIFVFGSALGRDHTLVANSASFALLERPEPYTDAPAQHAPDVAAAPSIDEGPGDVRAAAESRAVSRPSGGGTRSGGVIAVEVAVVVAFVCGIAIVLWRRWTTDVIVYSVTDLPSGVMPHQVRWRAASDSRDRVRVGPLQRQEWHLVDEAKSTHLVLAWKDIHPSTSYEDGLTSGSAAD